MHCSPSSEEGKSVLNAAGITELRERLTDLREQQLVGSSSLVSEDFSKGFPVSAIEEIIDNASISFTEQTVQTNTSVTNFALFGCIKAKVRIIQISLLR